ncbi:MAG: 3-hydroxyacyl-CoA dehydrogenase NAD-binding domain-containing protein, partial [Ramlibacter sp.]
MNTLYDTIGVVGAGAMGRGIAQIAAQAGSRVRVFDTQPDAASRAMQDIGKQWDRLAEKGRMEATAVDGCKARLVAATSLDQLADCRLVIEAVVERLDV